MRKKRRNHSPAFKAKISLAAVKGDVTLKELSKQFGINANLVTKWKRHFLENSESAFVLEKELATKEKKIKTLQTKFGEISVVNDFLLKKSQSLTNEARKKLISKKHKLSLVKQCQTLSIPRSSYYYKGK